MLASIPRMRDHDTDPHLIRLAREDKLCVAARAIAAGERTRSEALGHREFILTDKSFEPIDPACLPLAW